MICATRARMGAKAARKAARKWRGRPFGNCPTANIRPAATADPPGGAVLGNVTTNRPAPKQTEIVTRHLPLRARALPGQSLVVTAHRPLRDAGKK